MLLLTGRSWPEVDFSADDETNTFTINGHRLVLAKSKSIEGHHTVRTATTVWDAGIVLAKYFEFQQKEVALSGKNVIELGCGRGIAGLAAAALGANVVLTDMDSVIPTLEENIALNNFKNVTAKALDWTNRKHGFGCFDTIIAADVIWVQELIEPLVQTISELLGPESTCILAHQTRSSRGDEAFYEACVRFGLDVSPLDRSLMDPLFRKDAINIFNIRKGP